jgi:hypothetical protein
MIYLQNFGNSANNNMNMNLIIPGRALQLEQKSANFETLVQAAGIYFLGTHTICQLIVLFAN